MTSYCIVEINQIEKGGHCMVLLTGEIYQSYFKNEHAESRVLRNLPEAHTVLSRAGWTGFETGKYDSGARGLHHRTVLAFLSNKRKWILIPPTPSISCLLKFLVVKHIWKWLK